MDFVVSSDLPFHYCSLSVASWQEKLAKLGNYRGPIDGVSAHPEFWDAVVAFARSRGFSEIGAPVRGQPQYPWPANFCAALTDAAASVVTTDPSYYCGMSVSELQTRLARLGYYKGAINGSASSSEFWDAVVAFAQSRGFSEIAALGPGKTQWPLPDYYCAALAAADPRAGLRAAASTMVRSGALKVAPKSDTPAPVTYVETPAEPGWWASQKPATRYAIIGGGLLAVGAVAYYATRK